MGTEDANSCCPHADGDHVLRYCTIPNCGCRQYRGDLTPNQTAAFHRGVDAAKEAIRGEANTDDAHYFAAVFINAIARKCGVDHLAAQNKDQEIATIITDTFATAPSAPPVVDSRGVEAKAVKNLLALLKKDAQGFWCFKSFGSDFVKFSSIVDRLAGSRDEGEQNDR